MPYDGEISGEQDVSPRRFLKPILAAIRRHPRRKSRRARERTSERASRYLSETGTRYARGLSFDCNNMSRARDGVFARG